jgi:hypothetical protein
MNKVLGFGVGLVMTAATTVLVLLIIRHFKPAANLAGLEQAQRAVGPDAFRDVA